MIARASVLQTASGPIGADIGASGLEASAEHNSMCAESPCRGDRHV
jgi:hypothetical protein